MVDVLDDLILRAKKNDQQAFNELFNRYWDKVYNFLIARSKNEYFSEQLTIETFAKVFDKIYSYDSSFRFETWIISIAKNHYIDWRRKSHREYQLANTSNIREYDLPSEVPNAEERLISLQKVDEVLECIKRLKKESRTLIKLYYIEDLSLKEVAQRLNQPLNTIKVKIFRSKKQLIQMLDEKI